MTKVLLNLTEQREHAGFFLLRCYDCGLSFHLSQTAAPRPPPQECQGPEGLSTHLDVHFT